MDSLGALGREPSRQGRIADRRTAHEGRIRVLLIGDDPGEARLMRRMLSEAGRFEVRHEAGMGGAMKALGRVQAHDVVLLDLHLPECGGLDSLARVQGACPGISVVVMSGQGGEPLALEAVRRGAQDYLPKDAVTPQILARAILYAMERKKAQDMLVVRDTALASSITAIAIADLSGRLTYVNGAFLRLWGYDRKEHVLGAVVSEFWHDREAAAKVVAALNDRGGWTGELLALRRDGRTFHTECSASMVRDASGHPIGLMGSFLDITERKVAEARLERQALYDALTQLPNRVLYFDRLMQAHNRSLRQRGYLFGVLFLDIDRFKIINDSLGHSIGDQLLRGLGQRLQGCLRPGDTVARLGGDEFGLIIDNISDVSDVTVVAERIHRALDAPFPLEGQDVFVSVSIGIAFNHKKYQSHLDITRDADTAMYRAKARGKGCHDIFDDEMHEYVMCVMQMENDLRRAVKQQAFRLYYQPILCLEGQRVAGAEALVRWQHPVRGLILPGEFISLAEETGMISSIGEYVLREAVAQCRSFRDMGCGDFFVAVNCSTRQFQDPGFPALVNGLLGEYGLSPKLLELEITESIAMGDSARAVMHELQDIGVGISIDDFGTGYSSLSQLKKFPVKTLKIDRSFVSDLAGDYDAREIVTAIMAMAQAMNLGIVAEGVETHEQLDFLRSHGCDAAQGYLFSRPVPPERIRDMLTGGAGP